MSSSRVDGAAEQSATPKQWTEHRVSVTAAEEPSDEESILLRDQLLPATGRHGRRQRSKAWLQLCLLAALLALTAATSIVAWSRLVPRSSPEDTAPLFQPSPAPARCLCSSMYQPWQEPIVQDAAAPGRLPWRLSPGRSYAEWDACPAMQPRSALVYSAPALTGPSLQQNASLHGTSSADIWQLPPCIAFDVWLATAAPTLATQPSQQPNNHSTIDTAASATVLAPSPSYRPPVYTLQLTVFNQEVAVIGHLRALLSLTSAAETFELVVVFDDCTDHSIPLVHAFLTAAMAGCRMERNTSAGHLSDESEWPEEFIPTLPTLSPLAAPLDFDATELSSACLNPALVHVRTVVQPTSVWETVANNIGARAASPHSDFVVFIQDDQLMTQQDWNAVLAAPARLWPSEVVAVTARCAQTMYTPADGSTVGRCNNDVSQPLNWPPAQRCTFYIRDSGNRGPLLVRHSALRQLGYFDEVHFWLDDSDHDLAARAYQQLGGLVGLMPLDFVAPIGLGATRRSSPPLPESTKSYFKARKERAQQTWNTLNGVRQQAAALQWKDHSDDRPLSGQVFQQCVQYYQRQQHANDTTPPWYSMEELRSKVQPLTPFLEPFLTDIQ